MYSTDIIHENLTRVFSRLKFPAKLTQFKSIKEARFYVKHFNSLLDENGELSRSLRPNGFKKDEIDYIQAERILCKYSFRYWATRYAHIKTKLVRSDAVVVLFRPNIAQSIVLDLWAAKEAQRRMILMIQLKARQLGVSTLTELAICHRMLYYRDVNALVASSSPEQSRKMTDMITLAVDRMPFWLLPEDLIQYESGEGLLWSKALNSAVTVQHGRKTTGIARGDTPDCFHLSELSAYDNPEDLVDASLMRAFHTDRRNFGILESTADPDGPWWEATWEASKEGLTRFDPIFLPWFVGTDLYPTRDEQIEHPVPEHYTPIEKAASHALRAKEYVSMTPLLSKYLGPDWEMPVKQVWYWEFNYLSAKRGSTLNKFYQEMPADDKEAFQSANIMVFDVDELNDLAKECRAPLGCYMLVGPDIPKALWPTRDEIDWRLVDQPKGKPAGYLYETGDTFTGKGVISITADWLFGQAVMSFQMIPVKMEGYPACKWSNRFFIWEMPRAGNEYCMGADTSFGLGKDRSVLEIIRKGNFHRPASQVAEYANAYVNSMLLAPFAIALGTMYSPAGAEYVEQCKAAIENNGNGETTQLEMTKIGWSNFHMWERYDNTRRSVSTKKGWYTNVWSRPMLIDRFNYAIRNGSIQINSPWLIDELKTLSKDEYQQSIKADYGKFDDRYMACGIGHFSLEVWEQIFGSDTTSAATREQAEAREAQRRIRETATEHLFDFTLPTLDTKLPTAQNWPFVDGMDEWSK